MRGSARLWFGLLLFPASVMAASLGVEQFLLLNPTNSARVLDRYNGPVVVHDGFYLSARINGIDSSEISTDYLLDWSAGVGVGGSGSVGFTRSINNNGTVSESIGLYVSPDAARGRYAGLSGLTVSGGTSVIVLEGFTGDPGASTANGVAIYAGNRVTWTQSSGGGSIEFAHPDAVPIGSTLRLSNGSTTAGDNQFGLLGFTYEVLPGTTPGLAGIRAPGNQTTVVSWYGDIAEDYRLQSRVSLDSGAWLTASDRLKGAGGMLAVTGAMVAARSFYRVIPDATGMALGANVNESGRALDLALMEQSRTEWVRGFLPIKSFLNGSRRLAGDAVLEGVRRAVFSGRKLVLCLKLNFDTDTYRVPGAGTAYETETFQWIDDLMTQLEGLVSALETVNETFVDTHPDDLLPGSDGVIPMVRYLQRLVAHVHSRGYTTPAGDPMPLYSGGFTRLYDSGMRSRPAVPALLAWIQADSRLTGPNLHIHASDSSQFQDSFDFLRQTVRTKPAIVTEFSMVWKYKANLEKPLATWPTGAVFASTYARSPALTVREYVNLAIASGVSETEWNAFLSAMPWYDTAFLGNAARVMESNGTAIATFAFQQNSSGGAALDPGDAPWILNPVFANRTATNTLPSTPVNQSFFADYIEW